MVTTADYTDHYSGRHDPTATRRYVAAILGERRTAQPSTSRQVRCKCGWQSRTSTDHGRVTAEYHKHRAACHDDDDRS
jgi:hypothetical protein